MAPHLTPADCDQALVDRLDADLDASLRNGHAPTLEEHLRIVVAVLQPLVAHELHAEADRLPPEQARRAHAAIDEARAGWWRRERPSWPPNARLVYTPPPALPAVRSREPRPRATRRTRSSRASRDGPSEDDEPDPLTPPRRREGSA